MAGGPGSGIPGASGGGDVHGLIAAYDRGVAKSMPAMLKWPGSRGGDCVTAEFDPRSLRDLRDRLDDGLAELEGDLAEVGRFVNGKRTLLVDLGSVVVELRALPASSIGDWFRSHFDAWISNPGSAPVVAEARRQVEYRHRTTDELEQLAREVVADAIEITMESGHRPHVPATDAEREAARREFLSVMQDRTRRVR